LINNWLGFFGANRDVNSAYEHDSPQNTRIEMHDTNIQNIGRSGKFVNKDPLPTNNAAILIRGATKRYGSGPPVLRNLNMTVAEGSM